MKIARAPAGALLLSLSAGAPAHQPFVIKFSHVVAENTPKGKAALTANAAKDTGDE